MTRHLLPSSETTHRRPLLTLGDSNSPHSPSGRPASTQINGSYKVQKIGKIVKGLCKQLGKIFVRAKYPSSSVSVMRATAIDVLPDDILLQIFDFCRLGHIPLRSPFHPVLEWHRLIHVCRRWRQIIFSSPRRLDLYLLCTYGTHVRKNLGRWPAFPIIVDYAKYPDGNSKSFSSNDEDNLIAALEHPHRVRCLKLAVTSLLLGKVATVAQEPFPALTQLWLTSGDGSVSVLPSAFLGGSTPRLQGIHLEGISFPTLPAFLSSATDLVVLYLHRIPHTGYFTPEAMVATLAALIRLDVLYIGFQSPTSRPNQGGSRRRATPATRAFLPAVTFFAFRGASEYLEDLVAQIDAPQLGSIWITYFNQLVFQVPQLFRFIGRTQILEQARTMDAEVHFHRSLVYINLYYEQMESRRRIPFDLQISCEGLDWQVSQLAEVLSQTSTVLSNVDHLSIDAFDLKPSWRDDTDHIEWLRLFCQFTAVETLWVSALLAGHVADALKDVTVEMAPEILPALCLLCLEEEPVGRYEGFVTARQLSNLPVIIANTPDEFLNRRESRLWRKEKIPQRLSSP